MGDGFSLIILAWSVFSAFFPDLDIIPYLFLRKKLSLKSHRVIGHHPLIVLPLIAVLSSGVAQIVHEPPINFVMIGIAGTFLHFIHDSVCPEGLHWLSPFLWQRFALDTNGITSVNPEVFQKRVAEIGQNFSQQFFDRQEPIRWLNVVIWILLFFLILFLS